MGPAVHGPVLLHEGEGRSLKLTLSPTAIEAAAGAGGTDERACERHGEHDHQTSQYSDLEHPPTLR